jgi:hypothetical protein
VGDSYTNTGTASGGGHDKVHGADGGDAGATCGPHACDDEFFGDSYAASCPKAGPCGLISGGGKDLVTSDQGADFLNGGPPNDKNARPRQDICNGGTGHDQGMQCEFYKDVEVRLPTKY